MFSLEVIPCAVCNGLESTEHMTGVYDPDTQTIVYVCSGCLKTLGPQKIVESPDRYKED